MDKRSARNIFGTPLKPCCSETRTGFYRDGFCHTDVRDIGAHVVCALLTQDFLDFTKSQGNDLTTPRPELDFPGLKPGDKWCLCALRWQEAYEVGVAPPLLPESTHEKALLFLDKKNLEESFYPLGR